MYNKRTKSTQNIYPKVGKNARIERAELKTDEKKARKKKYDSAFV